MPSDGDEEVSAFSVADYVVFAVVLSINSGIGVYFAFRGNKNTEDFLMGGRKMSVIPVSISLLSSFITSITLLGYSGEAYAHGIQLNMLILGAFVGIFMASRLFLPVFFSLRLTSVNEYIELRFNSRILRIVLMSTKMLSGTFVSGLWLYAPALALSTVTAVSIDTYILILGFVCTIYSAVGGLKAVVWTDTFQMAIILVGLVSVIITGCLEVGGITNVWNIATQHGRTDLFDLSFNVYERHNLLNVFILGSAFYFYLYGADQTTLQRACSVPSFENAKRVYYINLVGMILSVTLVFFSGLCAFASYAGCDPLTQGHIFTKDQILPYFVMDKMKYLHGMPGLFVAALLSGAMSSMSSLINSLVAMIWTDIMQQISFFQNLSSTWATVVNKLLSFLIGVIMICLALLAKGFGGLFQISMTSLGILGGPMMGVNSVGVLVPHVGKKGVSAGLIVSTAVMTWISVGATYYSPKPSMLPFSMENCSSIITNQSLTSAFQEVLHSPNVTTISMINEGVTEEFMIDEFSELISETSYSQDKITEGVEICTPAVTESSEDEQKDSVQEWPMMYFYGISYTIYTALGSLLCITTSIIVTLIIGAEDLSQIKPELIAPISRRFLPDAKLRRNDPKVVLGTYSPVNTFELKDLKSDYLL